MTQSSNNRSKCPSVAALLLRLTIISVLCYGTLNAQPLSTKGPASIKVASPVPKTFPGDPFTKITEGEIVSDGSAVTTGCSWADYDNDGDLDLYSCNYGHNNYFYVNNGDGTFTRITAVHIIHPGNSNAGAWADYDNDGDLDLIVANDGDYFDMNSWFKSNGDASFTQIVLGPIANDGGSSQGVSWADYDNDGQLDLFIPNGFFSPQLNFLYNNNGDGTFARILTGDVATDLGTSVNASWSDYDNDGDLDLFVVDLSADNYFYINNGDGTFTRSKTINITNGGEYTWGSSWGDYDNDGDMDLFISRWGHNGLYRNNGDGSFTKDTTSGIGNQTANSVSGIWADYDNDGDLDLFVANDFDADNFLYTNNGNGTFANDTSSIVASDGGASEACTWGDYDNDGKLDLFVSNLQENNFLYRNNGNGNSWINILCVGTASNRSSIGAKVRAKATINGATVWQLHEIEGQSGYRSQNSSNVEFGFGDATTIDSLLVQWPSGIVDTLTNVAVNQFITITEGQVIPGVSQGKNDLPKDFDLKQNYPNPFNPSTTIHYSVPQTSHVTLRVYNVLGQEIVTLVDEEQEAGEHEVRFTPQEKARQTAGGLASGAYFYRIYARPLNSNSGGRFLVTRKLMYLR